MKKVLLLALAVVTTMSLVACGEKEEEKEPVENPTSEVAVISNEPAPSTDVSSEVEEQVGVGNTDESMVALVLEQYLKEGNPEIDEVVPSDIRIYTEEEIANNAALKEHNLNSGDIVFDAHYELKISEDAEDLMKYTAATGEIDGQWIRNKFNCGILRSSENGYTMDAFGTGF